MAKVLDPSKRAALQLLVDRSRQAPEATTAIEAVAVKTQVARSLILELMAAVDTHFRVAQSDPGNWGYAGDMGHLAEKLGEALSSIADLED